MNNRLLTAADFWYAADMTKNAEKCKLDKNLQFLQHAPLNTLKKIFIQYRFFTHYYVTDLAILISKLPLGEMRSILAEILYEELGHGKATGAHPKLYDDFLLSLGIPQAELTNANILCIRNLENIQKQLVDKNWAYGLGLRGMGGECLCQIYLATMYEYFKNNKAIIAENHHLAWTFWEIHIGGIDLHHQDVMRDALNNLMAEYPEVISDLTAGYLESRKAWSVFWMQIFKSAQEEQYENFN